MTSAAQGSPTCATCEHFEVNAAEAFSFCGDVKPNPMSYKETTATFGCIFHAPRPSSPDQGEETL